MYYLIAFFIRDREVREEGRAPSTGQYVLTLNYQGIQILLF